MAEPEKGRGTRRGPGRTPQGNAPRTPEGDAKRTHDGAGGSGGGASARVAAVRRLLRVEEEGAYVARLGGDLGADEARLASDLVAGVTRLRRRLDFLLAPHVRGGLDRLDGPLRQALRVGLYDLVERGTPPHAAVGEAVEAAATVSHRGGAGLVNAVLRAAARATAGGVARPQTGDVAEDLAVWHSYPTWLVRRWLDRLGPEEAEALLAVGNVAPTFGLRANRLKMTPTVLAGEVAALGVGVRRSRWIDDVLVVERLQPVLASGLVRDGRAAVQDEAAALVVRVLDPQPGETILDAAAAPGGKTLYAAARMRNEGRLIALDVHGGKVGLLEEAAAAHGARIVEPVAADLRVATGRPGLKEAFDRVLLDAPCSGLGVLARRADLRWNRSEDDLATLARLQDELLDAAAVAVRPGGLLVYATCSVEPVENEERVAAFLARNGAFSGEDVGALVPDEMRTPAGHYAAFPHRHGTDGAFAARLRRSA
jgi:16S rRNA (cytosine967-C5)-methyltransferase